MTSAISNVSMSTAQHSTPASLPLTCNEIAGNFSLMGNGPIVIDAKPGVILHVRSGLVQVCHSEEEGQQLVQGGQTFVLDRTGPVGLAAIDRAEVRLEWPLVRAQRVPASPRPRQAFAYA